MKVGLLLPQLGESASRDSILYVAREAEKAGLDSVWALERLLAPIKPQTPYVGTKDGLLPAEYSTVFDPIDILAFLAANTERILLGTSVIDMLFHNPVVLARRFATLDLLSRGRVIAGLGLGWSKDEYDASGIPYKDRGRRADEFLQVLNRTWKDDVVEFKGRFYNVPASRIGPKPAQRPRPPIILGGFTSKTFARIAKYADGWMPIVGFGPLEQLEGSVKGLKETARQAGRDPSELRIVVLTYPNVSESASPSAERLPMSGTIDQIGSDMVRMKGIDGIDHVILGYAFSPVGKDAGKMLELTKQLARFAKD